MRTRQESSFCCRLSNNFKWCITTALSSIIKPFRMINPVETIIAAGAMMGIMPIVSKQFHKLEKAHFIPDGRNDDVNPLYYFLALDMAICGTFIARYYLKAVLNDHSDQDNREISRLKSIPAILLCESIAATPMIVYSYVPADYNIPAYSLVTLGGMALCIKYVNFYKSHRYGILEEDNAISCGDILLKSIITTSRAALSISALFSIELNNQDVVGSKGFDQYLAWATCYAMPLALSTFIQNNYFSLYGTEQLREDRCVAKLIVNTLAAISTFGRGVAGTLFAYDGLMSVGVPEDYALPISIISLGIVANLATTNTERLQLIQSVCTIDASDVTIKNGALFFISTLQGFLLALPQCTQAIIAVPRLSDDEHTQKVIYAFTIPFVIKETLFFTKLAFRAFSDFQLFNNQIALDDVMIGPLDYDVPALGNHIQYDYDPLEM
jgi:hypothetical protein